MQTTENRSETSDNERKSQSRVTPGIYPGLGRLSAKSGSSPTSVSGILQSNNIIQGNDESSPNALKNVGRKHGRDETGKTSLQSNDAVHSPERRRRLSESHHSADRHQHDRSFVHHEYHDYSGLSGIGLTSPPVLKQKGRGGVSSMFPTVLHHMLDDAEKNGFSDVVSWQPHGRAFHVHQTEEFVKDVMPLYFRHTRFPSFQRQLSLYGFIRLTRKGIDRGAYYHECFLRGLPHLCSNMQRTRVKGTAVRQSSSPETEPDFTCVPPVGTKHPSFKKQAAPRSEQRPREGRSSFVEKFFPDQPQNKDEFKEQPIPSLACGGNLATSRAAYPAFGSAPQLWEEQQRQQQTASHLVEASAISRRSSPAFERQWGSKYMRHLMLRAKEQTLLQQGRKDSWTELSPLRGPLKTDSDAKEQILQQGRKDSSTELSPLRGSLKTDSDLAVFLQEVNLDSDNDEAFEGEEAMARILEEDVTKISEV